MPQAPGIRTLGASIVMQELRRQGFDVEKIASAARLEERTLNRKDAWIPFCKHAELLEIAAQETGDECLGLRAAMLVDPRDLGAIGYVGLSSRTLGDALVNLKRYLATINEAVRLDLSIEANLARLAFEPVDPSFLRDRQAMEFAAGAHVHGYRFFTRRRIAPLEVQFAHAFAGGAKDQQRLLGCPVSFGRNRSQIILNQQDLALPIDSADDRLLEVLKSHCDEILKQRARDNPQDLARVERCIVDLLPKGEAKARIVAREMGMSERSLVRYLAGMGTSFTEVLGKLRHELALKYLQQSDLNLDHITFLLGYANQSAFSTAFKRATGRTPREMRSKP